MMLYYCYHKPGEAHLFELVAIGDSTSIIASLSPYQGVVCPGLDAGCRLYNMVLNMHEMA